MADVKLNKSADKGAVNDERKKKPLNDLGVLFLWGSTFGVIIAIILMACCLKDKACGTFLSNFSLFVAVSAGAAAVGGLLGFLFGIPRSMQKGEPGPDNTNSHGDNTNLEQISDWLTKIIVGVSLIQWNNIQKAFATMMSYLAAGYDDGSRLVAYPFMTGLVLFFAIEGFIIIYLWSKLDLLFMFNNGGRLARLTNAVEANVTEKMQQKVRETVQEEVEENRSTLDKGLRDMKLRNLGLEIASLETKKVMFTRQKTRIIDAESVTEIKSVVDLLKPDPVTVLDDPQKFRWGGLPEAGGYRLSASYDPDPNGDGYELEIAVSLVQDGVGQLTGDVYFFLHDSYYPDCVVKVEATSNRASFRIKAIEAFTVGAVCLDAQVKLELDMNMDPAAPEDFRYSEPLISIFALDEKLKSLIAQKESL